jgi:hypothetical protein
MPESLKCLTYLAVSSLLQPPGMLDPTMAIVQDAHSILPVALLALATHRMIHQGEWDNHAHLLLGIWASGPGLSAVHAHIHGSSMRSVIGGIAFTTTQYFGTLSTSIFIHRCFLHRLGRVSSRFAMTCAPAYPWCYSSVDRFSPDSQSSTPSLQVYFHTISITSP